MQHQPVGRREQHLEEDEEVEEVAGQEGAVQPHQQELEQAVEMLPLPVPAGGGEDQRRQGEHRGQEQHQRRQPVEHQHDGEGRGPVAEQVEPDLGAARGRLGAVEEREGDERQHRGGDQADDPLRLPVLVEQHQRPGEQRDQDRGDDQMLRPRAHSCGSLPSTWSVPVRPREASSTTRNSAVVAKLMTMAVRTSACGTGST